MTVSNHIVVVLALACLAAVPGARTVAQEPASDSLLTVNHYLDMEGVSDPQLSPDGAQILYTRRWVNKLEDKFESAIWAMRADGSHNRLLVKGSGPRWSPDGSRILYLADGEPKGTQIFVRWMDAEGATSQVTRTEHAPGDPKWSPDGKSIAFVMFVPQSDNWKIAMPAAPEGAKWTPAPRMEDRLHYRQDRVGFTDPGFTHLFVVSADGGTPRQLTNGNWNVGARFDGLTGGAGLAWTTDGKAMLFDGLQDSAGDYAYQSSQVYRVDVTSGGVKRLTTRPGFWANPTISPDGRLVAYAGYDSSAKSHTTAGLYVMGTDGSQPRKIDGTLDRDPQELNWAGDNTGVFFTVQDTGTQNVHFAAVAGGVKTITTGTHLLSLNSLAKDLSAVGTETDFTHPGNVVRYSLKRFEGTTRLTSVNDDVLAGKHLAQEQELWYRSSGNARVEAWIVTPPGFDPHKKYPLILEIHGGPYSEYTVGWSYMFQNFAADGYLVLYVNPRGSTAYGTAFSDGIDHNYPGPDYDDLMAGVDTVIGRGIVDTTRMFVSGCSGGGVLSSWVIGHTQRFAAAAVRCPVIDWISMAGVTDVPLFTYSLFSDPWWNKPEPWLAHSSLMYVGHITTPTLLMTGELDRRTPMPQSEEFFAALKMNHVPTVLLRFADEYHGTGSKPSNFMRTQLYMMSWFQKWSGGAKGGTRQVSDRTP
ncbi:MAG TPA: S9 family peptidase [Gemmatimonadales bacterium]|jgi:dipeptidyl aminopeptidase/acylaminoacyl peptidase|nr:S9 family peptidase [Gemmatimonadales bacterium]